MRVWLPLALALAGCRSATPDPFPESSPWLLTDDRALLSIQDGALIAFDAPSGEPVWRLSPPPPPRRPISEPPLHVVCEPAVVGSSIVLRIEDELLVLSVSGGIERRAGAEPVEYFASAACPVSFDESTFVFAADGGTRIVRSTLTGHDLWSQALPEGQRADRAVTVLRPRQTLLVRTEQSLVCLDRDGSTVWSRPLAAYE